RTGISTRPWPSSTSPPPRTRWSSPSAWRRGSGRASASALSTPDPGSTGPSGSGFYCCMGSDSLRRLPLRGERLDRILGGDVGDGVIRTTHAGEAVPAALDGLIQALVVGGAKEVAMGLDRHLLVALEVDGRRHLGREWLGQKRHSVEPPSEARAYNRTRQPPPPDATGKAAICAEAKIRARGRRSS